MTNNVSESSVSSFKRKLNISSDGSVSDISNLHGRSNKNHDAKERTAETQITATEVVPTIQPPFFFTDDIVGERYVESAKLPESRRVEGTRIVWERTQNVLELPILGHNRTYDKRPDRAIPNPWRRHGALVKIHEIGGWISKLEKQQMSRRNRKYHFVKAGSKPCNPPIRPPITIRHSKFLPSSSINLPPASSQDVEKLAYIAAVQIQEAIHKSLSVILSSQQLDTTKPGDDRNGTSNYGLMKSSDASSSEQGFSGRPKFSLTDSSESQSMTLVNRKRG